MKKTVHVTIEKIITVDINDEALSESNLDEFEKTIFLLGANRQNELFKHAAEQYAMYEYIQFIDGIGSVSGSGFPDIVVKFLCEREDIESEII